ncbi:hypothetical protein HanIR_Chr05g0211731 [Helianthus annuus]|nr:hypothetical protein HanIR_Chr05g0211731 [Helianthus annuus]
MAVFPREIRGEESRVEDETDGIIDPLVLAKGVVTAFVTNDPQASQDAGLTKPVNWPC